jgi:hypothetical protein
MATGARRPESVSPRRAVRMPTALALRRYANPKCPAPVP